MILIIISVILHVLVLLFGLWAASWVTDDNIAKLTDKLVEKYGYDVDEHEDAIKLELLEMVAPYRLKYMLLLVTTMIVTSFALYFENAGYLLILGIASISIPLIIISNKMKRIS